MATVILVKNPLTFSDASSESYQITGVSFRDWLRYHYGAGFYEFPTATVCSLNGSPLMREEWDKRILLPDDIVCIFPVQQDPVALIAVAVVAVVAAVSVSLILTAPAPSVATGARQDFGKPDPVFTFKGKQNQNRLGFPIESGYGLNRHFPSFAAAPYTRYENNNQFLFALFCLGHGDYELDDIWIEDTQISKFQEAEAFFIAPGEEVSLFDNNVVTSGEVASIELFGPNETDYPAGGGWAGPFILNPSGTESDRIEIDFVLPEGLGVQNDQGGLDVANAAYQVQFQTVDSSGSPVGDWIDQSDSMVIEQYFRQIITGTRGGGSHPGPWMITSASWTDSDGQGSIGDVIVTDSSPVGGFNTQREIKRYSNAGGFTFKTITPQRSTKTFHMPEKARWQFRARRVDNAPTSHRASGKLVLEQVRAFLPNISDFGDKTLLAVRIRASNNINDNSSQRINCWATRKLPIWDSETGWSTPQATRNPVWACIDIFKSSYGGRLTDDFLDLVGLKALADDFDSLGITFDWIFDQKITVWEAAQTVLAVGRSIPLLDGSQIIAIRDDAKEIPNYIFNQHNILKGSFDYSIKLPGQDDNDGLEVTYQSENDRTDETVICLLEDDPNPPENPERIRIPGITNRDKAYQLGLHLRAKRRYHTRNLKIQTGSEGHLPLFGSKIAVAHDMFENHGTGSFVQSIASDGKTIELFEPVSFNEEDIYQIVIRDKLGDLIGPYLVTKGDSNKTIVTNEEIPQEDLNRIYFDPEFEPPLVIFGKNNPWSKQFTVVRVESVEDGNFEIIGVNYTDEIYSFDDLTAPPIESNSFQKDSDIPSISNLNVRQITNTLNQAIATWVPFPGVRAYIIEQSFDQKESWETMGQTATNFFTFQPIPGRMDIRLSAVNKGQSDFLFWSGVLGSVRGIDDAGNSISDDAGNIAIE